MLVVWLYMKMFLEILSNRRGKWQVISERISNKEYILIGYKMRKNMLTPFNFGTSYGY